MAECPICDSDSAVCLLGVVDDDLFLWGHFCDECKFVADVPLTDAVREKVRETLVFLARPASKPSFDNKPEMKNYPMMDELTREIMPDLVQEFSDDILTDFISGARSVTQWNDPETVEVMDLVGFDGEYCITGTDFSEIDDDDRETYLSVMTER